jgi:transposase
LPEAGRVRHQRECDDGGRENGQIRAGPAEDLVPGHAAGGQQGDPTNEIGAAWGVTERLRMLLAESEPAKIRRRLADFYDAAIDAQLPEATRLAETIQTWWPAILVALTEDASNARTEGFNRIIKQTKRVGCGYRNMINYRRRILSHIAVSRPQKSAA